MSAATVEFEPPLVEAAALTDLGYRPLQDMLRERLREAILNAEYPPGARLNTHRIARQYSVSPVPIREALRALEAEGLVDFSPNRGATVRTLSVAELREVFFIRLPLETETTRVAVERMTEDQLRDLEDLLQRSRQAMADPSQFLRFNREFHLRLYQAAGMPRVQQILQGLYAVANASQQMTTRHARAGNLQADHEAIFEACRVRDPAQATRIMKRHLARSRDALIATLERAQPAPAARAATRG